MSDNEIAIQALMAAKESANWAFWSMIGTWFAGVATFLAVLTSLYIANKRPRPKIKASITHSAALGLMQKRGVGIDIANVGSVPLRISSLVWHYGGNGTLFHEFDPVSSRLPIRLEHGESAFFFIHSDENVRWDRDIKNVILESGGKVEKLRLAISLGTKERIFIKPSKSIISMIQKA